MKNIFAHFLCFVFLIRTHGHFSVVGGCCLETFGPQFPCLFIFRVRQHTKVYFKPAHVIDILMAIGSFTL